MADNPTESPSDNPRDNPSDNPADSPSDSSADNSSDGSTYVIVGASLAGAKAAEGLRDAGFDGAVVLVGDEPERPYERPPLSKGYLMGPGDIAARDKMYVHDESWYAEHDVQLRLGAAATGLHRDERQVELAGGERLGYDRLLIATGSSPRRLQVPGSDLTGIHYLRRVGDSEAIRDAFTGEGPLVVVGGGWIGLEVAAAARHHGIQVTLVEPQPTPLFGVLGRGVGEISPRCTAPTASTCAPAPGSAASRATAAASRG